MSHRWRSMLDSDFRVRPILDGTVLFFQHVQLLALLLFHRAALGRPRDSRDLPLHKSQTPLVALQVVLCILILRRTSQRPDNFHSIWKPAPTVPSTASFRSSNTNLSTLNFPHSTNNVS
uniref:(northern house mosquito) hypothetical protein n=1 Tax=Culex pipiens TaxID=7175 RepID=A0A8D8D5I7_CULPI